MPTVDYEDAVLPSLHGYVFGVAASWLQGGGDTEPPEVLDVTPPPGSSLRRTDPVSFSVVDNEGFSGLFFWVEYASGRWEPVHLGGVFAPLFSGSSREVISGGYRFTLRRNGGWPAPPTVRVAVVDSSGNRAEP